MMIRKCIRLTLFILLAVFLFRLPVFAAAPSGFAGQWKLNAKESDDPHKKFAEAFEKSDRNNRMKDNDKDKSKPPEHKESPMAAKNAGPFDAPDTLNIQVTDDWVKIADSKGNDRTFYADGRKTSQEVGKGRTLTFVGGWEEDAFVIRTQGPDGGTLTMTYYLSQDGAQLYVKLQLRPIFIDEPVTIIRVYDPVSAQTQTQTQPM